MVSEEGTNQDGFAQPEAGGGGVSQLAHYQSTVEEEKAASTIQTRFRSHAEKRAKQGMFLTRRPDQVWYGVVDTIMGKTEQQQRWKRLTEDASLLGRGSVAGDNSLMLKREHWLEATDHLHRYGSNLEPYHSVWAAGASTQPFFFWLDSGDGATLDLPEAPRSKLNKQRLHYLTSAERDAVEAEVGPDGLLRYTGSGDTVHTLTDEEAAVLAADPSAWRRREQEIAALSRGGDAGVSEEERKAAKKARNTNKWIFVASSDMKRFYIAPKVKGTFGHSSFLSGGAVGAAGQISVNQGTIVKMSPMSGHYVPNIGHYIAFLDCLARQGVDLGRALLLNPFEGACLPANCPYDLQEARLDALDDKEHT